MKKLPTRFFSRKQEQKVANDLGGKPTPNSGARPYQKGDISISQKYDLQDDGSVKETESWLFEAKTSTTTKQSFAIRKQWLDTIKEEALQAGKMNYALVFSFGPNQENYYILSEKKFKELFERND